MSLTGLKIKNHWWGDAQSLQSVNYDLNDYAASTSPDHIPRNWLIRITPQVGASILTGPGAGVPVYGDYRICAADITISGVQYSAPDDYYNTGSGWDLGRAPLSGYGTQITGDNFEWILSGPAVANTLDGDWPILQPGGGAGLVTDATNPWYGNYSTSAEWGGSGSKPYIMTPQWITYLMTAYYNGTSTASIQAQGEALVEQNADTMNSLNPIKAWTWFDTIGVDENGIGLPGNEVIMIVTLKPSYTIPEIPAGEDFPIILSDIDGNGTFVPVEAAAMIINPNITFQSGLTIDNSPNTTITVTTDHTVTQETEDRGFAKQKENLVFSGTVQKDKPTKIASIKIEADSGYYLSKKPYLTTKFGDNISVSISSKTKSSGKINSYTINVVYNNNKRTSTIGYPTGSVMCKVEEIYVRPTQIDSFTINTSCIISRGENRIIRIIGTPGATFGLAVNENFQNKMVDPNPDLSPAVTRYVTNKSNDISILSSGRVGGTYDFGYGKELPVLKGIINSKGYYSFTQKFPSVEAITTKTSASKTTATRIAVDSTSGIREDDKVYARQITDVLTPVVTNIHSATEVDVSPAITIGDNEILTFKRNKQYSVNLIPDLTSTIDSRVITKYTLKQYTNPILKLRLTEGTGSSFTITQFNDVATGLSAGADHDVAYVGESKKGSTRLIKIKYLISCGANITAVTMPIFSKRQQSSSSWTNSVLKDNGRMDINISNFQNTAIGSTTITLTFDLLINKWGTEDVVMALDLDDVLTHA